MTTSLSALWRGKVNNVAGNNVGKRRGRGGWEPRAILCLIWQLVPDLTWVRGEEKDQGLLADHEKGAGCFRPMAVGKGRKKGAPLLKVLVPKRGKREKKQ